MVVGRSRTKATSKGPSAAVIGGYQIPEGETTNDQQLAAND